MIAQKWNSSVDTATGWVAASGSKATLFQRSISSKDISLLFYDTSIFAAYWFYFGYWG